jgi:hypothetical protein
MDVYFLIVDVHGLARLDRAMGTNVIDAVLAALEPRIADLVARELVLLPDAGPLRELRRDSSLGAMPAEAALRSAAQTGPGHAPDLIAITAEKGHQSAIACPWLRKTSGPSHSL